MNDDLAHYESFLEIICDEINVKQLVIENSTIKGLKVIYNHDTIKGGGYTEVLHNGEVVNAPRTAVILIKSFLSQEVSH